MVENDHGQKVFGSVQKEEKSCAQGRKEWQTEKIIPFLLDFFDILAINLSFSDVALQKTTNIRP